MLLTILDASRGNLPAKLRWTMLSGDWIPVDLPGRLGKYAPQNHLLSLGGATEASIWSIAYPVEKVDPGWTSIPYGMPLANQTIHVLDDRFEACPEWTTGEIFIGGIGVAMGYLADEAKTKERFVKSPVTGEQLYRTGDFGRFRPEGFVEFLGRKDTQVKIRGYRIEIGEIEAALLRLPGVREAAALTVSSTAGDRSAGVLVGCVVLQKKPASGEPAPGEDGFRSDLAQSLPSHMIPSRIIVLDELPLSANGKVDRRILLERVAPTLVSEDRGVKDEPQDALERSIWNIWKDLLPDRRIGRHDRFYEIGGDSLSVLHMIMRVEKMVGRPIGLRPMQQGGRIVDIAAAARETGPAAPPPMMIGINTGGSKPPLFFAHGDLATGGIYCQRMAQNLGPDQPLYVVSPHGAAGGSLPSTYEEVGTNFVELIRSAQKHGPYHLGGFCNGALAMFEAGHQLKRAGETVASLVMLDPPDLSLFLSRRKISRLGKLLGLPEGEGRDTYHRIAEGMEIWQDHGVLRFMRDFWIRGLAWTSKTFRNFFQPPDPMLSMTSLETAYYEAMVRYECQVYHDATWIILREGESHRHPRQISYWSEYIPAAHFEVVPGTHLELTGNMDEIAEIIRNAIGRSFSTAAAGSAR
jgi:thioesterase domain-containing protein